MKRLKQFLQRWLDIQDLSQRVYDIEQEIAWPDEEDLVEVDPRAEPELSAALGINYKDSPVVIEPTVVETPKPEVIKGYEQRY